MATGGAEAEARPQATNAASRQARSRPSKPTPNDDSPPCGVKRPSSTQQASHWTPRPARPRQVDSPPGKRNGAPLQRLRRTRIGPNTRAKYVDLRMDPFVSPDGPAKPEFRPQPRARQRYPRARRERRRSCHIASCMASVRDLYLSGISALRGLALAPRIAILEPTCCQGVGAEPPHAAAVAGPRAPALRDHLVAHGVGAVRAAGVPLANLALAGGLSRGEEAKRLVARRLANETLPSTRGGPTSSTNLGATG